MDGPFKSFKPRFLLVQRLPGNAAWWFVCWNSSHCQEFRVAAIQLDVPPAKEWKSHAEKKSKNRFPCFIVGWLQDTMRVMYTFCIGIYSIYSMHFFRSLFQDGTRYHFAGEFWIQACWNFLCTTVTTVLVGQLFVWEGTEDMGSNYGPFCHNLWHL